MVLRMRITEESQAKFRQTLQSELVERCKRNPKYSLRAFSRALEVEPSFLSKLLSGKRRFTIGTAKKISDKLGFSLVSEPAASAYVDLKAEAFTVISQWYHLAILELLEVKSFEPTVKKIAQIFSISQVEAKDAVERLERLNLISIKEKKWKNISGNNSTLSIGATTASLRALQKKILQQAAEALDECSAELRDQSAMTMAIDTKLLPQAKERIKKFRREFCDFLQKNRECDEVYQLSVSLFPVSRVKKGRL